MQAVADMPSTSKPAGEKKLWGGRFTGDTDPLMVQFNESLPVDKRMWREDIQAGSGRPAGTPTRTSGVTRVADRLAAGLQGSQAYAAALAKAGVVTQQEADEISTGLQQVRLASCTLLCRYPVLYNSLEAARSVQVASEWESNSFEVKPGDEDIHTANERRLTEVVGSVGGKLHTGRSRNDQVQTCVCLAVNPACAAVLDRVGLD